MTDTLHYSTLVNKFHLDNFEAKGFKTASKLNDTSGDKSLDAWQIENLKPINLFIGPNNSGKSRLLRFLLISDLGSVDSDSLPIQSILDKILDTTGSLLLPSELLNTGHYSTDLRPEIRREIYGSHIQNLNYKNLKITISNICKNLISKRYNTVYQGHAEIYASTLMNLMSNQALLPYVEKYSDRVFQKTYIPLLRGLRTLSTNDLYLDRTLVDYFNNKGFRPNNGANENDVLNIFTGHTLYEDLKRALLGDHEQRKSVRDYESFLSNYFFDNQEIALVPRIIIDEETQIENNVVHIKIGEKKERPIFDLGDGIQTIILLTVQAFLNEEPTMFFIEEPEQNVHAGLQRTLIEAFRMRPQHMYFMTTHSNTFIDLAQECDDISLQRVYQIVDGSEETTVVESSDANLSILQELGVRASSVLIANCSIWVEGVTDKNYLRVFLKKYLETLEESGKEDDKVRAQKLRNYKENLHYIFTEYQGSNITHWDFGDSDTSKTPARKLSNSIFLLADRDIETKGDRVNDLTSQLGNNFHQLKWKEIENHIPHNVVVETAERRWKTFNGKKLHQFNKELVVEGVFENETTGIGEILEQYVEAVPEATEDKKIRYFFKENSGTIKDKVTFCNTAIEIMQDEDFEWALTDELNELCEAIWKHIEESN